MFWSLLNLVSFCVSCKTFKNFYKDGSTVHCHSFISSIVLAPKAAVLYQWPKRTSVCAGDSRRGAAGSSRWEIWGRLGERRLCPAAGGHSDNVHVRFTCCVQLNSTY